jgi:CAAX prenyl protease-like protein
VSTDRRFHRYGIRTLVIPFAFYLSVMAAAGWFDGRSYPKGYSLAIGLTLILMLAVRRGYACAPFSLSWLSVAVGVLGVFVWIGLWRIDQEYLGLGSLFGSSREAFNPFEELRNEPTWMWSFLAIRFAGLVVVVPVIEEFFVRGFLMRYIDSQDWDRVPLGKATWLSVGGVAAYGLLSHPAEPLSAIVWFSMVTWLYLRTRSIWDCVLAHATTNLLLGLYVLGTGSWALW